MARRAKKSTRARASVARARARRPSPQARAAKTRREHKLKRSLAAKLGWRRKWRREGKKRIIKRKRTPPPTVHYDFLLSFSFSAGKREYRRDMVVPAPMGTSPAKLIDMARKQLPKAAAALAPFLTEKNVTVYLGPVTTRKRPELR